MDTNQIDFEENLGPALAALRKRSGKSGRQVAKEIGRSHAGVYRYENGRSDFSAWTLFKYLVAVNASLVDLHEAIHEQVRSRTQGRSESI